MIKKYTSFILILVLCVSCVSVNRVQESISYGRYDDAINDIIKKLKTKKNHPKKEPYILLLEDAYAKANIKDTELIAHTIKSGTTKDYEKVYQAYKRLRYRQEKISPLLPLNIISDGRQANFTMANYSDDIIDAKTHLCASLYADAEKLLSYNEKSAAREAHSLLVKLSKLCANYKETSSMMEEAHNKGTEYVYVSIHNSTRQIIPKDLEYDLLDINTYGLDDFWTSYTSNPDPNWHYDFEIQLHFQNIQISPERENMREYSREQEIKDGWEYKKDSNGQLIEDDEGKPIKIDKFRRVRSRVFEYKQFKACNFIASVRELNLKSNTRGRENTINSEFIFENIYGDFRGDREALYPEDINLINNRPIPFPSNEQMIYDAGMDLKEQFKSYLPRRT